MTEREAEEIAIHCRDAARSLAVPVMLRQLLRDAHEALTWLLAELEEAETGGYWPIGDDE